MSIPFFVFFENVYLYVISHKGTLRNIFIFRAVSGPIAILVNNQKTFDTDITVEAMVTSIEKEFYIKILPLKKEHMQTYARLEINEAQRHKDPSDHVIIAHAITEHLPLISSDTRFEFYRTQGLDLIFNKK